MTITKLAGPAGGTAAISRSVPFLLSRGPLAVSPMGGAAPIETSQPLQLFVVKLSDITDEGFIKKAVPVGWRYLIVGQGPLAVADVKEAAGVQQASLSSLIRGPLVERLSQAAELAEQKYSDDPNSFEVRILEIPSLYITALWLHGPRDIFIPFLEGAPQEGAAVAEDPSFLSRVVAKATEKRRPLATP